MDDSLVIMEGSQLFRILLLQWIVALSFGRQSIVESFLFQWMVALSLWKVVYCRDICYSNGWQPSHYGRQFIVEIFFILMDGSLVIWKVVYCRDFCYPMDGSLFIMKRSLLSRFLLFQWMAALSLWKVVFCRDFCYSIEWQPCHYGRQYVVDIFDIPMDGSLVIMEGSLLLIFLLLQWMVALSLWKVVCC